VCVLYVCDCGDLDPHFCTEIIKQMILSLQYKLKTMNYLKHTDEVLERIQANQLLVIISQANNNKKWALDQIKRIENDALFSIKPTQESMDDFKALHIHIEFAAEALKFAKDELKEIGFYLN
jgi:hypothetical protein